MSLLWYQIFREILVFCDGTSGLILPHIVDWRDKPISLPGQCFNKSRIVRGITKYLAKSHHSRVEAVVEVDKGTWLPKTVTKLFPADKLSRVLQQYP